MSIVDPIDVRSGYQLGHGTVFDASEFSDAFVSALYELDLSSHGLWAERRHLKSKPPRDLVLMAGPAFELGMPLTVLARLIRAHGSSVEDGYEILCCKLMVASSLENVLQILSVAGDLTEVEVSKPVRQFVSPIRPISSTPTSTATGKMCIIV